MRNKTSSACHSFRSLPKMSLELVFEGPSAVLERDRNKLAAGRLEVTT